VRGLLRRHPLAGFFTLACGFSWLVSLPHIASVWGPGPDGFQVGFMLKQWVGPALAATVMTAVLEGRGGVRALRSRRRQWRAGWPWYLAVLFGAPALVLVGVLVAVGLPASPPEPWTQFLARYAVSFVLVFFAVGLPEELGWRGFALPRLQERFGPLRGTLLLGLAWAGWHLPFFLTPDHGGGPHADPVAVATNFAVFAGMVVALAFPFTLVYNRTGGSVPLVSLLHAAIDTPQLVWLPLWVPVGAENTTRGEWQLDLAMLGTSAVLDGAILVATRGRLGLSPATADASSRDSAAAVAR
jgi:membrane protease YdiL (CAAX protease family)